MFEDVKSCYCGKFVSSGDWIHPDRVLDSNEIIFVTKGEVYINAGGMEYCVQPNETLILQANLRHFGYRSSRDTEFFWVHWRGGPDITPNIKHRRIKNPYVISLYIHQLLDARFSQKSTESMDYLTRLILIELYSNSNPPALNRTAEKIAAWIDANCHNPITEAEIAAQFGYNPDYLNRLFKKNFSKSIKQYIDIKRMEYIKGLMLCSDLPLKEIANKSGFGDYKYFLKFFKYHEKLTPTEFYNQYARIPINSR